MTQWRAISRDPNKEALDSKEFKVSPLTAHLLRHRGLSDPETVAQFFAPSLDALYDPHLLPDYEAAEAELIRARDEKITIYLHGDYDVDGVTSAAIFHRFLTAIGCKVITKIPHRIHDGYGISNENIQEAVDCGAGLILTCDCGINAVEPVQEAKSRGLRVVITDHHMPGEVLPAADAVVNPKRTDSQYPFKELSGAGVVFKLCYGLCETLNLPKSKYFEYFIDLATLGTVADMMLMLDENRIIVSNGLKYLSKTNKIGLQELFKETKISQSIESGKSVQPTDISFKIGPRLNAAGRMDHADIAFNLLITKDQDRAQALVKQIETINTSRRDMANLQFKEASKLAEKLAETNRGFLLAADKDFHPGLIGLLAGQLLEEFKTPAGAATLGANGNWKASLRGGDQLDLMAMIDALKPLIEGGGHKGAAGIEFAFNDLEQVQAAMNQFAIDHLGSSLADDEIEADAEILPNESSYASATNISALGPFGLGNREPLLLAKTMKIASKNLSRCSNHVFFQLEFPTGEKVKANAFFKSEKMKDLEPGDVVDVLFNLIANEFRGQQSGEWKIVELRKS